uniref:RING-CH-type domain-containing protein n=1 Tax=Steinernema glaseri TaxID=37863 RepID=A0A1I8A8N7_9BILA
MDSNEDASCRICYIGSAEEPLFTPCKCSGSVKYLHQRCWELQCAHRQNNDGTCELCQHRMETQEVYLDLGLVTWTVYFNALGKYVLSSAFFCVMVLSQCVPHYIAGFPSLTVTFLTYKILSSLNYLDEMLFEEEYSRKRLPTLGDVSSPHKINNVRYWSILKHHGYLALPLLCIGLTEVFVLSRIDGILETGLAIWVKWFVNIPDSPTAVNHIVTIIIITNTTFMIIYDCYEDSTWKNSIFSYVHLVYIGTVINMLITSFCTGWFIDVSSPVLQLLTVCCIATYYLAAIPTFQFFCIYYDNVDFDYIDLFYPLHYDNIYDNLKAIFVSIAYSHLHLFTFILVPLLATSYVFPDWLHLGEYLHPEYVYSITTKSGEFVEVNAILAWVNMAVKALFVVHWLCSCIHLYDCFIDCQQYVYEKFKWSGGDQ